MKINLVVILGPTASGKTKLAVRLARNLGAEIISADSRQVYRGMNLGTGKDLKDYQVDGELVPYHLIDIVDPDYEFSIFDYQQHFFSCFAAIRARNVLPIMVGGTGLYLDAVLKGYHLPKAPENIALRAKLEDKSMDALIEHLQRLNPRLHNTTDTLDRQRLIRAIEIAERTRNSDKDEPVFPPVRPFVLGVRWPRAVLRQRITIRLKERLEQGMVEEVRALHERGLSWERLEAFGLEYRYIGWYLQGRLGYEEMFRQLNVRIHQFAKRQETWFRRMENQGTAIHWLNQPGPDELQTLMQRVLS